MSREENWKTRLREMQEASEKIIRYCSSLKSASDLANDQKTFDACIRNFQILGDAAKKVPKSIQEEFSTIPWKNIKGMRDVVVHEYFGTDSKVIWQTVEKHLPKLADNLKQINERIIAPSHPWKICSPGETYVTGSDVDTHLRSGYQVKNHLRSQHCRTNRSSSKNILSHGEVQAISRLFFNKLIHMPKPIDLGFKNGNSYDIFIAGWVQYWNEVLQPTQTLDVDLIKALIASESSFNAKSNIGKRSAAKGLMQILPSTLRYLRGDKNELKDNFFEFTDIEVFDPNLNIAAGVRWLFRKRETASARLKREATWEESVSEYKDYLHRSLKNPKVRQKGMEDFKRYFNQLKQRK